MPTSSWPRAREGHVFGWHTQESVIVAARAIEPQATDVTSNSAIIKDVP